MAEEAEQAGASAVSLPCLPFKQPTFVFIGGAPRSGTTLLSNLLDGHPEALVFPKEHGTLENFFRNRNNIETYARSSFIDQRSEGQQTLLANQNLYLEKQHQLFNEFGQRFDMDIDFLKFRSAYLEYLEKRPATLESMLSSLIYGQICGNPHTRTYAGSGTKCLVFKQPFFTELFAEKTSKQLVNYKFIQLTRDPVSRYVSAKTRRLNQCQSRRKRLGPINQKSYVVGHSLVDLASRKLASRNKKVLGESIYRTIKFEDLVADPKREIKSLLDWLDIEQSTDFEITPTRLGQPIDSSSTLSKGYGIDSGAIKRLEKYNLITSQAEQRVHNLFLRNSSAGMQKFEIATIASWLIPHPSSNWKNYICQINDLGRWLLKGSPASLEKFLDHARQGFVGISGGT